jgi:hypothetical protein
VRRGFKGGKGLPTLLTPLPYLTLTLTLTVTLTLRHSLTVLLVSPLFHVEHSARVHVYTSGLRGIRGPQIARKPPRNANLKSGYLHPNRPEISRLLRFGEISPLLRLANRCFYVLQNAKGIWYPLCTVGIPNQNQNII